MNKKCRINLYNLILSLVIIGAFLVVIMLAFLSKLGTPPDEWDVKVCLDWGISHWIWPDMRAKDVIPTYSGYGYSKVCNNTPYFLIAGKVAYFFRLFMENLPYYRMPNVLLMIFMTVFMLKKHREHRYLIFAFGMCAQAWYIFSYVTADTLDFVLAFLAVYILADENSILWRYIRNDAQAEASRGEQKSNATKEKSVNPIAATILLGLLYGVLLLGKPYYYATLALTFYALLMHLIKAEPAGRGIIWKKYLFILGFAGLIFAARYSIEVYYYGGDKAAVETEMADMYCTYDKKPSTPLQEQEITYHMYEKGYSVTDVFKYDTQWIKKSFRSYVSASVFGERDAWYLVLMACLYVALYIMVGISLWHKDKMTLLAGSLLNIGGVVASIINSYLIDVQPQGRYLLPIALTFAYMSSRADDLWTKKWFRATVVAAACMSIAHFGLFDSRRLIELAYVKTLL